MTEVLAPTQENIPPTTPTQQQEAPTLHINLELPDVKEGSEMPSPADSGVASGDISPSEDSVHSPVIQSPDPETAALQSPDLPPPVLDPSQQQTMTRTLMNGPDELVPASTLSTTQRDGAVRLRMRDIGPLSEKPISVMSLFKRTVEKHGSALAMAHKRDGAWKKWTYSQYHTEVRQAAKAFIKLGLEPYHGVGILGFNSPEWFLSDLGAIFAGGFAVGIYTTNSAEAVEYVANNARCNILVVENDQQLQKVLSIRDQLPHLKAIVQYNGIPKTKENTHSWAEFMECGKAVPDELLEDRIKSQAPNKCCTLIYTSGTTGTPKGVMLSHDNITWTAAVAGRDARLVMGQEVGVSYLPLSHIAAQMLDIYMPIMYAAALYFAQPDALKGSLATTLKEAQPTLFLGVPRVWEKMQEKITALGKQNSGLKRKIALWAKGVGIKGNMSLMNGSGKRKLGNTSMPFGWGFANKMVFKKVRAGLGLERCRLCLTGAAPITRDTLDFFMSLNIPLMELYGMSENSGPHSISYPWKYQITSVGTEIPGVSTKLENTDKDGNGEICMWGRHVFMGYLNMEEKTTEALDNEGWLHSGDIGRKDNHGFLYITGRIKELIITAGGENVAPVPIEDSVKEELPCISNCMLVGDKKKFLTILLTFKTEVDPDQGAPLDNLAPEALDWCRQRGSQVTTVTSLLESKEECVLRGIQEGIERANLKSVSRAQKIQKWTILPRDFSIPGEELGPTLKLKRPVVTNMYKNTIDAFYAD